MGSVQEVLGVWCGKSQYFLWTGNALKWWEEFSHLFSVQEEISWGLWGQSYRAEDLGSCRKAGFAQERRRFQCRDGKEEMCAEPRAAGEQTGILAPSPGDAWVSLETNSWDNHKKPQQPCWCWDLHWDSKSRGRAGETGLDFFHRAGKRMRGLLDQFWELTADCLLALLTPYSAPCFYNKKGAQSTSLASFISRKALQSELHCFLLCLFFFYNGLWNCSVLPSDRERLRPKKMSWHLEAFHPR